MRRITSALFAALGKCGTWSSRIGGGSAAEARAAVTPNLNVCQTGCFWSTNNRNESTVLVGVNYRFF